MGTTTSRLGLYKPIAGDGLENGQEWHAQMNQNLDRLDEAVPWKGRRHTVATTPSLQFYERCELDVQFTESCEMVTVTSDHPCWICVYGSAEARTRDAARLYSQPPVAGEGCMGEVSTYLPDHLTIDWSPSPMFHNSEAAVKPTAYISVRNMQAGYTGPINLDFVNLPQEQFTPSGPQGLTGLPGRTLLVGTIPPTALVGQDGDSYFDKVSLLYYGQKTGGAWPAGISLRGLAGKSIRWGTADPAPADGDDGEFFINITTHAMFGPKAAGAWPAGVSLIGPPWSPARAAISVTTAELAPGASAQVGLTMAKVAEVLSITTDYPAEVRLYDTAASRTADAGRPSLTPPAADAGVCSQDTTTAAKLAIHMARPVRFANHDAPITAAAYLAVTNKDAVARAITVTYTILPLEA